MSELSHQSVKRCAIYTRRSLGRGNFPHSSSLQNQRELCAAYVHSQCHRGWVEVKKPYEDNGISGGTLERPALQELLADIQSNKVDIVVVYRLDRLTRSLWDFMKLIELLDKLDVPFVCVAQTFDTGETLGRLVLNILLTFAQFERELIADRMRDRVRALAGKGCWTGGRPPFGYDRVDRRLVINKNAPTVRKIFELFRQHESISKALFHLTQGGPRPNQKDKKKVGKVKGELGQGTLYNILGNPVYVGEIRYDGQSYPGEHEPIVSRDLWDAVQRIRQAKGISERRAPVRKNLLTGFIFDAWGRRMLIFQRRNTENGQRYYTSLRDLKVNPRPPRAVAVDACRIEGEITSNIGSFLRNRFELSGALIKAVEYGSVLEKLFDHGPGAADLLESFEHDRLRLTYERLIQRIDVSRETVRILLKCDEIVSLLSLGHFSSAERHALRYNQSAAVHIIEFDAESVLLSRNFRIPVEPREPYGPFRPKPDLVSLIHLARKVHETVQLNRDLTVEQIAKRFERKPAYIARVLRANYLAPDIQTAILDGRQPPHLNRHQLLQGHLPMDWAEQRKLFGFPAQDELHDGPRPYVRRVRPAGKQSD